jgi:hypothetical protein
MSVFGRQVEARVTSLAWRRTVVVEQGFWEFRRTSWKPRGGNVRNIETIHSTEPDIVGGGRNPERPTMAPSRNPAHEVLANHTYYEYQELVWRKHRSLSAKGDSPADLHWPEYTLGPDQRIAQRRESYRATFATKNTNDELTAELDEQTWRSLKRVGRLVRLRVSLNDEVKHVEPT